MSIQTVDSGKLFIEAILCCFRSEKKGGRVGKKLELDQNTFVAAAVH
jgi:hypothetical protein